MIGLLGAKIWKENGVDFWEPDQPGPGRRRHRHRHRRREDEAHRQLHPAASRSAPSSRSSPTTSPGDRAQGRPHSRGRRGHGHRGRRPRLRRQRRHRRPLPGRGAPSRPPADATLSQTPEPSSGAKGGCRHPALRHFDKSVSGRDGDSTTREGGDVRHDRPMKPAPFTHHAPTSVEEAVAVLREVGHDGKVLAGGRASSPCSTCAWPSPRTSSTSMASADWPPWRSPTRRPGRRPRAARGAGAGGERTAYPPVVVPGPGNAAHPAIRNRARRWGRSPTPTRPVRCRPSPSHCRRDRGRLGERHPRDRGRRLSKGRWRPPWPRTS